jgi:DNA-binding CsgD family transcriptional regulator
VTIEADRRCIVHMGPRRYTRRSGALDQVVVDSIQYIPGPAFVVSECGVVLAENAPARAWLAALPKRVAALTQPGGPDPELFRVTMSTEGRRGHCLAVLRDTVANGGSDADAKLAVASRRWGLTPRQSQVLKQLSQGLSNARIASQLGCAEATVEIHVSRIFERAGVQSRASLLACLLWGRA